MIKPQELDELLSVMVKHGCTVLTHGDLEIRVAASSALGAQPSKVQSLINPYSSVSTLAEIDALYGVPQITKEGE